MRVYNVHYTAYEKGSTCNVISDGVMPVNTNSFYMAESTVKAMFSGANVIIRYTTEAR